jgi:uncharacterized protein YbjQ (UPF0145 family)
MSWLVTCNRCGSSYVYESGQGLPDICAKCAEKGSADVRGFLEKEKKRKEIIAVASSEFADREIQKTLGIVSHEEILGLALTKDLDIEKFRGGIALAWTEAVNTRRDLAIRFLKDEAIELGGNAVVEVDLTYRVLGIHNEMVIMLIGVRGTAVVLE